MLQNPLLLGIFLNFLTLLNKQTKMCSFYRFAQCNDTELFGAFFLQTYNLFCPSEVQINLMCQKDSQISLCRCFEKYKGVLTPLKSAILSFFHSSYPITLFGWHITHLSPQGSPSEAQINSTCHKDSQISHCGCFDECKGEVTPVKSPILSF